MHCQALRCPYGHTTSLYRPGSARIISRSHLAKKRSCDRMRLRVGTMVGVAEWLRHLVVAQKTVGSNPTAHPEVVEGGLPRGRPLCVWRSVFFPLPLPAGMAVCAMSPPLCQAPMPDGFSAGNHRTPGRKALRFLPERRSRHHHDGHGGRRIPSGRSIQSAAKWIRQVPLRSCETARVWTPRATKPCRMESSSPFLR